MKSISYFTLALLFTLLISSCTKDEPSASNPTQDLSSTKDHANAEIAFEDMFKQIEEIAATSDGFKLLRSGTLKSMSCTPEVTLDTMSDPKSITIDFGPINCLGNDGVLRRGKIFATFTGPPKQFGSVITVSPIGFYRNNHKVHGLKTQTNMGLNQNGHVYYHITVQNAGLLAPDSSYNTHWNSNRIKVWLQGFATNNHLDDVYLISGSSAGINRFTVQYEIEIIEPLRVEAACPFITKGIVEISPENLPVRLLDYGNGICDNVLHVTVNGQTFPIFL